MQMADLIPGKTRRGTFTNSWLEIIEKIDARAHNFSFKAHLHDIHFEHGTPKLWHAGQ